MHVWLWSVLAVFAAVGLLAIVSPRWFSVLTIQSSRWVDTDKALAIFDKRIDIDSHVLRYPRLFGSTVVAGVAVAMALIVRYRP